MSGDIIQNVENTTTFLDPYHPKIQERVFCIMNDINTIVKCPLTGEKLKFSLKH